MALFAVSFQDLMADSLSDLATNTNITKLTAGAIARALLESMNRRLADAYQTFDLNLARAFVSASTGQYLELIGTLLGITRAISSPASSTAEEQTIKLYIASGSFGDINSGNDITFTEGSIISSGPQSSGVVYTATEDVVLSKNSNVGWVSAQAATTGTGANVGSGSLLFHNFIGYSDYLNSSLLVTNVVPIANGGDIESDANFRYRIVNQVTQAEAANLAAIRLSILSVAGVADVILIPRYKGIGTTGAILKSTSPTVSQDLIDQVTAAVQGVQAYGDLVYVRAPLETGISMTLTIHYGKQLSEDTLTTIESNITTSITNYINNLDIGETFLVEKMIASLFSLDPNITNIGSLNKQIDQLYVYKESALGDNRVRQNLLGDYVPGSDERVIVEQSINQPITLNRSFIATLIG